MADPAPDLSRLRIDRDRPSRASVRSLVMSAALAAIAVAFIGVVFVWMRASGDIAVRVATAEIVGGGGAGAVGITANGYVVARTKASVASKISGRLAYLGVSEGSFVRQGEVMARLENRDYHAAVEQAEAGLLSAHAALRETEAARNQLVRDVARAEDLLAKGLASEQNAEDLRAQLEGAEARVGVRDAQVKSAEAAVGVAQANLENTIIRAPFTGTVLRKDAEVGEVVAPAATGGGLIRGAVVTMADLETLEVEVDVNEAYIAQISNAQPARIILDAYPDRTYGGAVRQIVPTADRQRATVQVKVSFLERDAGILPEMGARVEFLESGNADDETAVSPRIFVPADAVQLDGETTIVWIVRDGAVTRTVVEAGPVSGGRREIRAGLSGGERVVLEPSDDLENGANVSVQSS